MTPLLTCSSSRRSHAQCRAPRLGFLCCQARLAFASVVAYSRFNSTLLLLQGAESIGAYAWRFDDGSPLFTELPRRVIPEHRASDKYDSRKLGGMKSAGIIDSGAETSR